MDAEVEMSVMINKQIISIQVYDIVDVIPFKCRIIKIKLGEIQS